jgi:hypothetical protein
MKRTNFIAILLFGITGCHTIDNKSAIFNKKYECDSILIADDNYSFEDDNSIFSPMSKSSFNYEFKLIDEYFMIDNKKFYYLLAGLNIDTVGLIYITKDYFLYLKNINSSSPVLLFDFKAKNDETWFINDNGFFNNYQVSLSKKEYDENLKDTLYLFDLNYKGVTFPNGYYFELFEVSKKNGIIRFSLSNGVDCKCE